MASGAHAATGRGVTLAGVQLVVHDLAGVQVAFTHRAGGVSKRPFESLNLGLHVGDDPGRVDTNREHVAGALGIDRAMVRATLQVHGTQVHTTQADDPSAAWGTSPPAVEADALVTGDPGVALAVMVADCAPIAIVSRDGKRAAVHAGWRGLVDGVIEQLSCEVELAGARAVIGPCIGPCCFEVGDEVAARFQHTSVVRRAGAPRPFLDARSEAVARLRAVGIAHVDLIDTCTCCDRGYFSHRRDGPATGRQAMVVLPRRAGPSS